MFSWPFIIIKSLMPHHLAQIVLHLPTSAATEIKKLPCSIAFCWHRHNARSLYRLKVNTTEYINQHDQHVIMIIVQDDIIHASEATRNSAGDVSSHSLGGRTAIQIQMEPDPTKPDLTSYEVIKPENP